MRPNAIQKTLLFSLVGSLFLSACGPGHLVVTAEMDVVDPETGEMVTRPITDTEIEFLPFDRDAVFDSLTAAFGTPEPEIPQDLLDAQSQVAAAQQAWRDLEAQWAAIRDRLQTINEQMDGLSRGEQRYRELFNEFSDQEQRLSRVERQRDAAFERFTSLQEGIIARQDSVRFLREDWADEAFADAWDVFQAKVEESGRDIVYDTTDANGIVNPELPPGEWWVHARQELPLQVLYWNIPVTVVRGDPVPVLLNRANAEVRPNM
jgi:hypothetical protein